MSILHRGRQSVLMVLLAIFITVLMVVGLVGASTKTASSDAVYVSDSKVMKNLIDMTNRLRQQKGLPILNPSLALEQSAKSKLTDMNKQNYWDHYAPDKTSFSSFIWNEQPDAVIVGENLARCFDNHGQAFEGFVNSPAHYAVLTGDFNEIGIASQMVDTGCESIVLHVSR